ncbi:MAG: hypothetical protein ACI8W8_002695 [Rhodothermales bacterium]|jgi:hypothetical protein
MRILLTFLSIASTAWASERHLNAINYDGKPDTPVEALRDMELEWDRRHGYLPAVLKALDIDVSSQVLVFSKTSLQFRLISPRTPRVIYFNDRVYVGTIPGAPVLEFIAHDAERGAIFYTLSQNPKKAELVRNRDECFDCHAGSRTRGLPGHVLRSVYPDHDGQPLLSEGTFLVKDETLIPKRWGGWYVTGNHGDLMHMGNTIASRDEQTLHFAPKEHMNVSSLKGYFNTSRYLSDESDIVALSVLGHQAEMHNLICRASAETKLALADQARMDDLLDRARDGMSESTRSRINRVANQLLDYLLFCDEAPLHEAISGGAFTAEFTKRGPRDSEGRSLRDLALKDTLFEYPCSYLIYTPDFVALPDPVRSLVYQRLWEVLTGEDDSDRYLHITRRKSRAIINILRETHSDLPKYWHEG